MTEGGDVTGQCKTCFGWVPPAGRLYTDEGMFHDRLTCLAGEDYEALIADYGCKCETASSFTELEWHEHLDEEHSKSADVGMAAENVDASLPTGAEVRVRFPESAAAIPTLPRVTKQERAEAVGIVAALNVGAELRGGASEGSGANSGAMTGSGPVPTLIPGEYDSDDLDRLVRP